MANPTLTVSVIMTCYNEGAYIGQAVRSVLDQTRGDLVERIVIADDGSEPSTVAVLKELETWDSRIHVLYGPGGVGLPGQRNLAVAQTTSPLIAVLDGDDFWTKDKLEKQLPAFAKGEHIGLVYGDYFSFADGNLAGARRAGVLDLSDAQDVVRAYFLNDPPIIPSTTIIRRSAFDACGGFDAAVKVFEDTEFYIRLARIARFQLVSEPVLYKRVRKTSITGHRKDLLAHHAFIAFKAAAEEPRLLPLVPKRLAERARKLANQRFLAGDRADAQRIAALALRLSPHSPKVWIAFTLAMLPGPLAGVLKRKLFARRLDALTAVSDDSSAAVQAQGPT